MATSIGILAPEYLLKCATFYSHSVISKGFCSRNSVASNKAEADPQLWIKTAWDIELLESWLLVW